MGREKTVFPSFFSQKMGKENSGAFPPPFSFFENGGGRRGRFFLDVRKPPFRE
jgi:hypothetical protein